jgi:hypothetical protein
MAKAPDGASLPTPRATDARRKPVRPDEARLRGYVDTILTPLGTQYGATWGKPEQRKSLRNAGFANLSNLLQRLSDHS